MPTRRKFIEQAAGAVAGTSAVAAISTNATPSNAAEPTPQVEIRYVASPPPPKVGPHTGTLDPFIQQLKPGPDFPWSFLSAENKDLAAWKQATRAKVFELLHYAPEKCDPRPEVVSRRDCGDYIREEIRFNTTPVFRVPATVLIPKGRTAPGPAVLALHSHGGFFMWGRERMIEDDNQHPAILKLRTEGYGGRAYATELARRGYLVIAIDMFYWGERRMVLEDDPTEWKLRSASMTEDQVKRFNQRSSASEQLMGRTLFSAGTTWPGIMTWDDIRTLDYLVTRPDVDPQRIGAIGHSLGGLRVSYLAALDDRLRAAVSCGWMCSFPAQLREHIRSTIGHTKIIPGLYRNLDFPDLTSLAMPTPLMVINGKQDALFEVNGLLAAHAKLQACYSKAGVPDRFQSIVEDFPHRFSVKRQADAEAWFDRWLV